MFIVLGATGHVGSETARELLRLGHAVTAVTRDAGRAEGLRRSGATVATADLEDVDAMRSVFRSGKRLFLLNPPAAPDTDTDRVEQHTIARLLDASDGSGLERIVAESTYGAQPGERLGDLNTLHGLEEGLRARPIPHAVLRAAYYMSNWDAVLEPARRDGVLPTVFPAGLAIPMVAPADLGRAAAALLAAPDPVAGIHWVEGPRRCSSRDVADAFARALGRDVRPVVTDRDGWEAAFRGLGFSEPAARSYARMTGVVVDGAYDLPRDPVRGTTDLDAYVRALVARSGRS